MSCNMLINKALKLTGTAQQRQLPMAPRVLRRVWIVEEEVSGSGQLEARKASPRDLSSPGGVV